MHLEAGQLAEAEVAYRRLLDADDLHEAAHRGVIRALARQGEPARALRHYEAMAGVLAAEQGARPASETVALADRLRNGGSI
jgi:DNA-binding SARP family transcriptional activator